MGESHREKKSVAEIHMHKHCWLAIDSGLQLLVFDLRKLRACLPGLLILTSGFAPLIESYDQYKSSS